jgi:HlyD family secretion protein
MTGPADNSMSRRARVPLLAVFAHAGLPPEAIAFQDPIDEICERPAPQLLRGTLYLVVALFVALLGIAAFAKIDIVVVASGRLATATPPIVVQPMERSIVHDLRVRPGDVVSRGQILATLDPTFAEADADALHRQLHVLQAQVRRLEAEEAARPFAVGAQPDADDLLQKALYDQRQAEYATRLHVFDEDIQRLHAGLRTLDDGRGSFGRELGVAREVEGMRSASMQAQTGSRLNLLEAQAARMRAERDRQEADDRIRELQHSEQSREAERQAFVDGWRRELIEALVGARSEAGRVAALLAKASRLHDLVVVTSPADGTVLDVAARTEGSVLREAETLMTIVPKDAALIGEVMIASSDVGYTSAGAETQIKVDAYPYQRHGMLGGRLQSVAEESLLPGGGDAASAGRSGAFHRARVELLDTHLDHVPPGARLFPGMTLTAEIKGGTRSVLSYFLYPLSRGLHESMREP